MSVQTHSAEAHTRAARAATEYLAVAKVAPDLFEVVNESGDNTYVVDTEADRCTCPDHKHRGRDCKHLHRVRQARGDEAIPDALEFEDCDPLLFTQRSYLVEDNDE